MIIIMIIMMTIELLRQAESRRSHFNKYTTDLSIKLVNSLSVTSNRAEGNRLWLAISMTGTIANQSSATLKHLKRNVPIQYQVKIGIRCDTQCNINVMYDVVCMMAHIAKKQCGI
jgi:hypothetical protein